MIWCNCYTVLKTLLLNIFRNYCSIFVFCVSNLVFDIGNTINQLSKKNCYLFIVFYKPVWYLKWSDSKTFWITSSVFLPFPIFMLSLFECITHSSPVSLKEKKVFAIVNWNFYSYFSINYIFWDYLQNLLSMAKTYAKPCQTSKINIYNI